MKVYISGKVTGLPFCEVKEKFERAEWLLEDIGLNVVNPLKNGLSLQDSWEQHIVRDIGLLLECDGILMLTTWMDSKGASIEHFIAKTQGMTILFESTIAREHEIVAKIQNAIHEATGMAFESYSTEKTTWVRGRYPRKQNLCFARLIFAHHCDRNNINWLRYFIFDRSITYHMQKKFNWEMNFNPKFRKMAMRVEEILKIERVNNLSISLIQ